MLISAFVYAMGAPGDDLIKIGRSANPERRLKQVRADSRILNLALLHVESTENAIAAEQWAHRLLSAERIYRNEEWFLVSPARAIDAVKQGAHYSTLRGWRELVQRIVSEAPCL